QLRIAKVNGKHDRTRTAPACMHKGSELYMSGFYVEDIPAIREKAESLGMTFVHHREKNRWVAVKFIM
ncbi:MAG: hypothetical protein ACLTSS_10100, partial [Phocaeicola coprocola]